MAAESSADILLPKGAVTDAAEAPKDPLKDLMAAIQKGTEESLAVREARAKAEADTAAERKDVSEGFDAQLAALHGGAVETKAQPAPKAETDEKPAAVTAQEPAAKLDQAPADPAGKPAEAAEGEVKVTRALRKAAVAALEDSYPDAKELVEAVAKRGYGDVLKKIADDPKAALVAIEGATSKTDFQAIADALKVKREEKGESRDEKAFTEKLVEMDRRLDELSKLNPEFAKQANAAYDRYAAQQKAKNDALVARGEKPVEPMGRRDYLCGAYVAAAGVFLAGVPESSRAEAKAAVDALHASNPDGVARFLREVDPGTNERAAKASLESYSKAAGVDMDATGAKPAGTVVKEGVTVKVSRKGDTTIEEWPDGKTVYIGKDGESVENDGGRVTRKDAKGEVVARFTKENPTVSWVGRMGIPVSNAGKSAERIGADVDSANAMDKFASRMGMDFANREIFGIIEASWRAFPSTAPSFGPFGATELGNPPEPRKLEKVAQAFGRLVGLEDGELYDASTQGPSVAFMEKHHITDLRVWMRDRYMNGWTDKDGKWQSGPGASGSLNRGRAMKLLRGEGGDAGKAVAPEGHEAGNK